MSPSSMSWEQCPLDTISRTKLESSFGPSRRTFTRFCICEGGFLASFSRQGIKWAQQINYSRSSKVYNHATNKWRPINLIYWRTSLRYDCMGSKESMFFECSWEHLVLDCLEMKNMMDTKYLLFVVPVWNRGNRSHQPSMHSSKPTWAWYSNNI